MNVSIPRFPAFFDDNDKAVVKTFLNFEKYPNGIRSERAIIRESALGEEIVRGVLKRYQGIFFLPLVENKTPRWHFQSELYLLISLNSYVSLVDLQISIAMVVVPDDKNAATPNVGSCSAVATATIDPTLYSSLPPEALTTVDDGDDEDDEDEDEPPSESRSLSA